MPVKDSRAIEGSSIYQHWKPYQFSLCQYGKILSREYRDRGFRDSFEKQFASLLRKIEPSDEPPWLESPEIPSLHRAYLLTLSVADATFLSVRHRPEVHRLFPTLRKTWINADYHRAWRILGKPSPETACYGHMGWTEELLELDASINDLYPQRTEET